MDVFDKIISGDLPSYKIYEDDDVVSFLDIAPIRKGHCLVIPKKCVQTIDKLSESEILKLFSIVRKVDIKLREVTKCDAVNVFINDGPAAGQEVPHVHVHLVPRMVNDGPFDIYHKTKYNDGEAEEFCKKLKF